MNVEGLKDLWVPGDLYAVLGNAWVHIVPGAYRLHCLWC